MKKRFDIVFTDTNIFKKGVTFVSTGKDDHEIIYVNPSKFDPEEYAFGLCGIQATMVKSKIYMTVDQVWYMMTRLRTSTLTKLHPGDTICIWRDIDSGNVTCRIGNFNFESNGYNSSDFRTWAEWAIEVTFPEYAE